jgi:hypothetical protein
MRIAEQEGKTGGREKEMCLLLWEDVHCYLPREGGYPSGMLALFALDWKRAFHSTETNGRELTR